MTQTVEVRLEHAGGRSAAGAMRRAVIGAGGGPVYRFVAASADADTGADGLPQSEDFPLGPLQELDQQTDDEWAALALRRLGELDERLTSEGWRRLPARGRHWWSLRYER
jgi:hypothetical protein